MEFLYVGAWIVVLIIAISTLHSAWKLPKSVPDFVDRLVALIFGIAAIGMPSGLVYFLSSRLSVWLWPLIALSATGLCIYAIKAAKGLPLVDLRG